MKQARKKTVQLIHLGCPKNQVDSEEMLGLLADAGFEPVTARSRADVLIVNTCGFLQAAREEGMEVVREAIRRRRGGQVGKLIVAGCLVQRYGEELAKLDGIDALVGAGRAHDVAQIAQADRVVGSPMVRVEAQPKHVWQRGAFRMVSTPPWTAYLKIAEGCDHPCTFCTIPAIRGAYTSKPLEQCLAEARALVAAGVRELTLVAQDTTRYGSDLPGHPDLYELVARLHEVEDLRWIRVFYAYPGRGLERLVAAMAEFPKLCRYLDVPLQHADSAVLRAMRRPGDGNRYVAMLDRMREIVPDLAIRTTLIVGFPGETPAAFENLVRFVESVRFDRLGVFEFSPEEGTPAAEMADQVPADERRRRRDAIMRMQQGISLERNREWVGRELEVLVEAVHARGSVGRSYRDGPEVDGSVFLRRSKALPGTFVRVRITRADIYDLEGEEIANAPARNAGEMTTEAQL